MSELSDAVERMRVEVESNGTVDGSAVELMNQIPELIRQAANAPDVVVALNELADTLQASNQAVANAVTANTPAAPTP